MNKTSNRAAKIGAVIMAIGVMLIIVKMPTAVHQPGLQAGIDKSYDVTADATGIPNGGARVEQTRRRPQHETTGGCVAANASPSIGAAEKSIG
jgi:hypothetical protein